MTKDEIAEGAINPLLIATKVLKGQTVESVYNAFVKHGIKYISKIFQDGKGVDQSHWLSKNCYSNTHDQGIVQYKTKTLPCIPWAGDIIGDAIIPPPTTLEIGKFVGDDYWYSNDSSYLEQTVHWTRVDSSRFESIRYHGIIMAHHSLLF